MAFTPSSSLDIMARFLPAGARVLNLDFAAGLVDRSVPDECVRVSPPIGDIDRDDVLNSVIEVPDGCYVLLRTPLAARGGGAPLLRSIAAARAHLLCVVPHAPDATGLPGAVADTIEASGCVVRSSVTADTGERIACVSRRPPAAAREFEVVTLSWSGLPNFGDRLGVHLIDPLLPAHATVRHEFRAAPSLLEQPIDVLVLGLGFSIFQPMLTDSLLQVVDHSARVIGVFGTQYRRSIDRAAMKALLARLDVWYARYDEDLLLFGGDCRTVHLGDWLIGAFPLARPRRRPALADTLVVGPEIMQEEVSLDRLIQRIQIYRRVVSARLHPLLCALTSAEEVAYYEQREDGSGEVSGKFRSMLLDVFGVHHPPDRFFAVDRSAVRRYRGHVQAGMHALGVDLRRAGAGEDLRKPAGTDRLAVA